jgi:hypothetical protein
MIFAAQLLCEVCRIVDELLLCPNGRGVAACGFAEVQNVNSEFPVCVFWHPDVTAF